MAAAFSETAGLFALRLNWGFLRWFRLRLLWLSGLFGGSFYCRLVLSALFAFTRNMGGWFAHRSGLLFRGEAGLLVIVVPAGRVDSFFWARFAGFGGSIAASCGSFAVIVCPARRIDAFLRR